ncbi:hypothetical protein BAMA111019_20245 [Bacillus manliponensis]
MNLDFITLNRVVAKRNGIVMEDLLLLGKRKTFKKNGFIFGESILLKNDVNQEQKVPRQEPLEHSWKKLNT